MARHGKADRISTYRVLSWLKCTVNCLGVSLPNAYLGILPNERELKRKELSVTPWVVSVSRLCSLPPSRIRSFLVSHHNTFGSTDLSRCKLGFCQVGRELFRLDFALV